MEGLKARLRIPFPPVPYRPNRKEKVSISYRACSFFLNEIGPARNRKVSTFHTREFNILA